MRRARAVRLDMALAYSDTCLLQGGTELIGHLGSTAGYTAFIGYLPIQGVTIAAAVNTRGDPSPVLVPAVEIVTKRGSQ